MQRLVPELFLEGPNFSPSVLAGKLGQKAHFRKSHERDDMHKSSTPYGFGSGILVTSQHQTDEDAVDAIVEIYEEILRLGMEALGIEEATLTLYVENVRQSNFSVSSRNLGRLAKAFDEVNFVVLEPDD